MLMMCFASPLLIAKPRRSSPSNHSSHHTAPMEEKCCAQGHVDSRLLTDSAAIYLFTQLQLVQSLCREPGEVVLSSLRGLYK